MADCHLVAYREAGFNPVAISSRTRSSARAVARRHGITKAYDDYEAVLDDPAVEVVDVAVPPDVQIDVIKQIVKRKGKIRGLLAQKPLGVDFRQAKQIVEMCDKAGIRLVVNQNMRYDHSVRACKSLLDRGVFGRPVLGTIDMRAIPHWMPWQQRQGWVTLRIMSIHHLDTFRYWFGDPQRIFASTTPDPRTQRKFEHADGVCLYILEYADGMRCSSWDDVWAGPAREGAAEDLGINWRVEGTTGMARGTIGWPKYPERSPSTIDFTTTATGEWHKPRWKKVWFPDAFVGPMAELLCDLEGSAPAQMTGQDNLKTMALVDAAYKSAREHRAVQLNEIM
ncbi:MAG: gfo/Idh/MocA family oxidoreductase [Phycisphaera sp.]|nr:gfo/Idh/MocA family oxidoreductase [Phycisphaera sp.]